MLKFFDYCYYCICKFYDRNGEGKASGLSALILLALLQYLNLVCIAGIYWQILRNYYVTTTSDKFIAGAVYFILLILNGFHYNKLNYDVLKDKWKDEDMETRQRKVSNVVLYIIFSIVAVVAVIIWRASTR